MKFTLLAATLICGAMFAGCQQKFTTGDAHRTIARSQVTHGETDDEFWSRNNRVTTINLRSMHEDWIRLWMFDRPSRASYYPVQ